MMDCRPWSWRVLWRLAGKAEVVRWAECEPNLTVPFPTNRRTQTPHSIFGHIHRLATQRLVNKCLNVNIQRVCTNGLGTSLGVNENLLVLPWGSRVVVTCLVNAQSGECPIVAPLQCSGFLSLADCQADWHRTGSQRSEVKRLTVTEWADYYSPTGTNLTSSIGVKSCSRGKGGGGISYKIYISMSRCKRYDFQVVESRKGCDISETFC